MLNRSSSSIASTALCGLLLAGCAHAEPPESSGLRNVAGLPARNAAPAVPSAAGAASPEAQSAPPSPSPSPAPPASTPAAGPDAPQTRDKPSASSETLRAGARALFDAMAHDDPARAEAFFFPVNAYKQVKDVANPERDWRYRLLAEYNQDIHDSAKDIGKGREDAQFVALEIPDRQARWVEPGEEWNKVGYYRVYNAQIVYTLRGREKRIPIKSMISWRGEWYCVHLRAIARKKS